MGLGFDLLEKHLPLEQYRTMCDSLNLQKVWSDILMRGHTNSNLDEYYAKIILEYMFPEQICHLHLCDKPDLQNKEFNMGIEVTSCVPQETQARESIWWKTMYNKSFRKNGITLLKNKYDVEFSDGLQVWPSCSYKYSMEDPSWKLFINRCEEKLKKINHGNYIIFAHNACFVDSCNNVTELFCREILSNLSELNAKYKVVFDTYYVTTQDGLIVFDMTKNSFILLPSFCDQQFLFARTARLCTILDEIKYQTIGEILGVHRGNRLTKGQLCDSGQYTVYHGSKDTPLGFYDKSNVDGDTVIIVNTGGIGGVRYCEKAFWCSDGSFYLGKSPLLNNKFVYYYVSQFEEYFQSKKRIGGVPTIDREVVEKLKIPVPPLPIQEEIVRILDTFTELEAELEAELEKRKLQYAFYRDELLRFDKFDGGGTPQWLQRLIEQYAPNGVEWKKLKDIASVTRGGNFQKSDFVENGVPCIHYGQIYTKYGLFTEHSFTFINETTAKKQRMAQYGDLILAVTSENFEDVCKGVVWLGESMVAISGHTAIISHNQNPKYMAYLFQSATFYNQKRKLTQGTKVIEVTPDRLNNVLIPVPPIQIQEAIVSILDKFSAMVEETNGLIPKEIEKGRKRYEYYRDKLLSFESY